MEVLSKHRIVLNLRFVHKYAKFCPICARSTIWAYKWYWIAWTSYQCTGSFSICDSCTNMPHFVQFVHEVRFDLKDGVDLRDLLSKLWIMLNSGLVHRYAKFCPICARSTIWAYKWYWIAWTSYPCTGSFSICDSCTNPPKFVQFVHEVRFDLKDGVELRDLLSKHWIMLNSGLVHKYDRFCPICARSTIWR